MTLLTEKQKRYIRAYIKMGATRKQISKLLLIPEGTISHYQNPNSSVNQNQTSKMLHKELAKTEARHRKEFEARNAKKVKFFTFTEEELNAHDESVREGAYHKVAVATVNKLSVLSNYPIHKALKELGKYAEYLIREYNLK
jgi:hypothetical protein